MVTNPGDGIGPLTDSQLVQIFTGQVKDWATFGGPDEPITIVYPNHIDWANAGFDLHLVSLNSVPFRPELFRDEVLSTDQGGAQVVNSVVNTPGAIGIVPSAAAESVGLAEASLVAVPFTLFNPTLSPDDLPQQPPPPPPDPAAFPPVAPAFTIKDAVQMARAYGAPVDKFETDGGIFIDLKTTPLGGLAYEWPLPADPKNYSGPGKNDESKPPAALINLSTFNTAEDAGACLTVLMVRRSHRDQWWSRLDNLRRSVWNFP